MRRSNLMVQKINQSPRIQFIIGTINRMQRTLDKGMILLRIMRNIDIGMLQPMQ